MLFNRQLQHLTTLASGGPAWKRYAWDRANELDSDSSGLFKGLADALTIAMGGQVKSLESERQSPARPRSVGQKSTLR